MKLTGVKFTSNILDSNVNSFNRKVKGLTSENIEYVLKFTMIGFMKCIGKTLDGTITFGWIFIKASIDEE